jgi:hypothetical protein
MRRGPFQLILVAAFALLVVLIARLVGWRAAPDRQAAPEESPGVASAPEPAIRPSTTPPSTVARTGQRASEDGAPADPLAEVDASAAAWAAVDMEEVRELMPDNLYWTMGFPTKDEAVIEARAAERERWNTEYGKVLSNTATEEEINAYYGHREKLSRDYASFAGFLLSKYGDKLPQRDVALLKLSVELHLARLEEIPRQITEAQERRVAHDAVRRAWLEDQKAFEGVAPEGE